MLNLPYLQHPPQRGEKRVQTAFTNTGTAYTLFQEQFNLVSHQENENRNEIQINQIYSNGNGRPPSPTPQPTLPDHLRRNETRKEPTPPPAQLQPTSSPSNRSAPKRALEAQKSTHEIAFLVTVGKGRYHRRENKPSELLRFATKREFQCSKLSSNPTFCKWFQKCRVDRTNRRNRASKAVL